MRIVVHARPDNRSIVQALRTLLPALEQHDITPVFRHDLVEVAKKAGCGDSPEQFDADGALPQDTDMILSLGGDGTLLDTVTMIGRVHIPVLGINLGRLGFLANVRQEDIESSVEAIAQKRFTLEERSLLCLKSDDDLFGRKNLAMNEVSVHKSDSSAMITVHAYLGERYLNTYWADGLLISTPTGSTAYSLSCGGPVMDPTCRDLIITPIAPHNLNVRPFVVPDDSQIKLVVDSREGKYLVAMDSRSKLLDSSTPLVIQRSEHSFLLVNLEGQDFLNTLRSKLTWGLDLRSGPPKRDQA